ncbi:lasso peptide biosynthesis B2 protein [Hydrogenophaga sp. MI9]|uniref:lasso peptide biosynthesis B2 protein n=1 Tax=Hydrogenophaga sp. MI9 TaxID=3453719 RepID=UPI003EEB50E9
MSQGRPTVLHWTADQWLTLAAAWWALPLCWFSLRRHGLARLHQRLRPTQGWLVAPDTLAPLGRAVNAAARISPFPSTCLSRSLVLMGWLTRRGIHSDLRIGVQLQQGQLHAHAWLEHQGTPINDQPEIAASFAVFDGPIPSLDRFTS